MIHIKPTILISLITSLCLLSGCGGVGSGNTPLPVGPTTFHVGYVYVGDLGLSLTIGGQVAAFPNLSFTNWKVYHPTSIARVRPGPLTFDPQGRMVFSFGTGLAELVRIDDMNGLNRIEFGTAGSGVNQFQDPEGVTIDAQGHIYVCDFTNQRVVRMDDMAGTNWTTLASAQGDDFGQPRDLVIDSLHRLYILSVLGKVVRVDDMTGANGVGYFPLGQTTQLQNPIGMAIDAQDRIYICDTGKSRIVRIDDITGANRVNFGSLGSGAGQFNTPQAIAIDGSGRILIADTSNGRVVRMDDMTGTNWTTVGHIGTTDGTFEGAFGLAVR